MARNNKPNNTTRPADSNSEPVTKEEPTTPLPAVGLGDLLGDGNNEPEEARLDQQEQHHEDQPPADLNNRGPAAASELRSERVTYPAKPAADCGPSVQSLTKAELGNRTSLHKVLCVCPEHHTPCYAGVREGIFTRMYCSVQGCNFSHKLVVPTTAELINRAARREQLSHPQHDITPR